MLNSLLKEIIRVPRTIVQTTADEVVKIFEGDRSE